MFNRVFNGFGLFRAIVAALIAAPPPLALLQTRAMHGSVPHLPRSRRGAGRTKSRVTLAREARRRGQRRSRAKRRKNRR